MSMASAACAQAPQGTSGLHETGPDGFAHVFGRGRGLPESCSPQSEAGALTERDLEHLGFADPEGALLILGDRATALSACLQHIGHPLQVPVWLTAGMRADCSRTEILRGEDDIQVAYASSVLHQVCAGAHEIMRDMLLLMLVYPERLSPDRRAFLEVGWKAMLPDTSVPRALPAP